MNKTEQCESCQGTGKAELTNCCGASYNEDYMMCSECHEHLGDEDIECEDCNGTGLKEDK